MPERLRVEEHLSTEELQERYEGSGDPVERSRYQIVWLLSQGRRTREVAEATGYGAEWVREVAGRYDRSGAEGLGDGRRRNPGGRGRVPLARERLRRLGRTPQVPRPAHAGADPAKHDEFRGNSPSG